MELKLATVPGQTAAVNSVVVADKVFGAKFNPALVHQVVTAYQAAGRQGTKAQKSRSEVSGGGIKPWKQKGTGHARAGTNRSPIWRKGGVTFAAKPRDYAQKVNKKMYQGAMRAILSELVNQNRLLVVDAIGLESPKTRELNRKLNDMKLNEVLIITENIDSKLYLAARNMYKVDVRDVSGIDPVSLVGFEHVMFTVPALKKIEEILG